MRTIIIITAAVAWGCGGGVEDKGYGAPLAPLDGSEHDEAVDIFRQIGALTAVPIDPIDPINYVANLVTDLDHIADVKRKLRAARPAPHATPDTTCIVVVGTHVTFHDCAWAGLVIEGSLDAGSTSVSGSLTVSGDIRLAATIDATVAFGCPTAGQVEIHDEKDDLWVKAVFGPTCYAVTLY